MTTKKLSILVDRKSLTHPAVQALQEKYEIGVLGGTETILSQYASYFDPAWWDDPRLVEAALKRVRAEKRKEKKA